MIVDAFTRWGYSFLLGLSRMSANGNRRARSLYLRKLVTGGMAGRPGQGHDH